MARIRTIKPEFFTDEKIGSLPPLVRLFFIGLWTQADRDGRLVLKERELKLKLLPYDKLNVKKAVEILVEFHLVTLSGAEVGIILTIKNFKRHQRPLMTEKPSELSKLIGTDNGYGTVTKPLDNGYGTLGREGKGREGKGRRESARETAPPENAQTETQKPEEPAHQKTKKNQGEIQPETIADFIASVDLNFYRETWLPAKPWLNLEILKTEIVTCHITAQSRGIDLLADFIAFWNSWLRNLKPPIPRKTQNDTSGTTSAFEEIRREEAAKTKTAKGENA